MHLNCWGNHAVYTKPSVLFGLIFSVRLISVYLHQACPRLFLGCLRFSASRHVIANWRKLYLKRLGPHKYHAIMFHIIPQRNVISISLSPLLFSILDKDVSVYVWQIEGNTVKSTISRNGVN